MSNETLTMTGPLYEYLLRTGVREPEVLRELRAETLRQTGPSARMQIAPEQGAFMGMLVTLMGAAKTLEAGVFTGYSTAAVALALPDDGKVVACDVSDKWAALAREFWQRAGVADRIDLRIAPAIDTRMACWPPGRAAPLTLFSWTRRKPNTKPITNGRWG